MTATTLFLSNDAAGSFTQVDCTSGDQTVTIAPAASVAPRVPLYFQKTDSSGNTATITDGGSFSVTLTSQYATLIIVSDGSSYVRQTPGSGGGGGGISGPGSTTVGNAVIWNDTTGTTVDDGGAIIDSTITTPADNDFLVYSSGQFVNQVPATARTSMGLGTLAVNSNLIGDVTATAGTPGNISTTIAAKAVTLAKMNDMATASMLGRNTAGTGAPEVLSAATARTVMAVDFKAGLVIPSPTNAEKIPLFRTHVACTITRISVVMIGSSPSVTWKLNKGSDISASGTAVVTAGTTTTNTTTGDDITSFDSAGISADNWVWLTTSAQSGTVTWMDITVYYTKD